MKNLINSINNSEDDDDDLISELAFDDEDEDLEVSEKEELEFRDLDELV